MSDNLQELLELASQIQMCRRLQEPRAWMELLGELDAHREIVRIMTTSTSNFPKMIDINSIEVSKDRRTVTSEDAQGMAASIREFGLIQPIVLVRVAGDPPHFVGERYKLVAGGHRLAGMRILGWQFLQHYAHYVVRGEDSTSQEGKLRLAAVELEENLRRKDLTWAEKVEQKAKLLELMESIHGETGAGRPSIKEQSKGEVTGFGVRKLAAMLNESPALVSQDLQLAKMVRAMPHLASLETKSAASRAGTLGVAMHIIKQEQALKAAVSNTTNDASSAATAAKPAPASFTLYEGRWQDYIANIEDGSIDLIYTDLPYGVSLNQMSSHMKGAISYDDPRVEVVKMLPQLMNQAYRILKEARYAIFWFGFNYYHELIEAVDHAGFSYNPVPVVWLKHRQATENPLQRYANAYEQALVCWKGDAKFIRPGQTNIIDIPAVAVGQKLQNAQQPIELVERFIKDMLLPNSMARVLDFTCGTGTTLVAAVKNGQFGIGFERDIEQCLIAKQRLSTTACQSSGKASATASAKR